MLTGILPIGHKWVHATIRIPIAYCIRQEIGHVRLVRLSSIPHIEITQKKSRLRGLGCD